MAKFGLKQKIIGSMNLGLIAGGVYLLYQSDVWGSGEKNEKLVKNLSVKGRKYLPDTAEYVDMIPPVNEMKRSTKDYWNSGVQRFFGSIASFPSTLRDKLTKS